MSPFKQGMNSFYNPEIVDGKLWPPTNPFDPHKQFGKYREFERGFNHAYYNNLKKMQNKEKLNEL